jgi:hypothetical protein
MIYQCKCGTIKTGQPWRCSGTAAWICERCSPAKRGREAMEAAREANGGKFHKLSEDMAV